MPAVDLDNVLTMQSVVARTPLGEIVFVTRNHRRVGYQFYRPSGPGAVDLAVGSTGQLLVKKKSDPAGDALARALSWTKEGTGPTAGYWFSLDLFTEELEAAFTASPEKLDDLILELTFVENGNVQTPPAVPCTIWNRYLQSDEDVPQPADPDMPAAADILTVQQVATQAEAEGGTNNVHWMTPLRTAQAIIAQVATCRVRTANFNVAAGGRYACNTSSGAFTATLPAEPGDGDRAEFLDSRKTWGTNNLTVARNGKTIDGTAADLVLDVEGGAVAMVYENNNWIVVF